MTERLNEAKSRVCVSLKFHPKSSYSENYFGLHCFYCTRIKNSFFQINFVLLRFYFYSELEKELYKATMQRTTQGIGFPPHSFSCVVLGMAERTAFLWLHTIILVFVFHARLSLCVGEKPQGRAGIRNGQHCQPTKNTTGRQCRI